MDLRIYSDCSYSGAWCNQIEEGEITCNKGAEVWLTVITSTDAYQEAKYEFFKKFLSHKNEDGTINKSKGYKEPNAE